MSAQAQATNLGRGAGTHRAHHRDSRSTHADDPKRIPPFQPTLGIEAWGA
ncbi:MAG TPA: hypothetical protein VNY52_01385 [Solirubrobacteraceae bacterium]|nr:hypothetical protein [Solirubrobacteraceae bacterium]